jgi:predicted kinase
MAMQAVLLIGIQGAGKTTFYEERLAATHVRISLDVVGTREGERALLTECIAARRDFAVDNTNILKRERASYIALAKAAGYEVIGYFFRPNMRGSIWRNQRRTDKKPLPVPAVIATFKRVEPPDRAEGIDALYAVEPAPDRTFTVSPV